MEVGQVRVLTLNIGENLQEKLFRLEKGNINIIMVLSFSVIRHFYLYHLNQHMRFIYTGYAPV